MYFSIPFWKLLSGLLAPQVDHPLGLALEPLQGFGLHETDLGLQPQHGFQLCLDPVMQLLQLAVPFLPVAKQCEDGDAMRRPSRLQIYPSSARRLHPLQGGDELLR